MTKTTRERILSTILERQRCTINDLAAAVGINPISVRHHIIKLEMQGLVASEEERHGVGRPPKVYFLTDSGREKFPTRYLRLARRLLEQFKDQFPEAVVSEMFARMARDMVTDYTDDVELDSLSMERRLDILKDVLTKEGFTVEWEREGERYLIHEITCPYYGIGERHPEICTMDATLISNLLLVPAQRVNCVLTGDAHCTYEINGNSAQPIQIEEIKNTA